MQMMVEKHKTKVYDLKVLAWAATRTSTQPKCERQISRMEFKMLNTALQHRHESYATVQRGDQQVWQLRKNKDMK